MEPATMLVGALEIHVRRVDGFRLVRIAQDGEMGAAGIEPDVERIFAFFISGALGTEQLFGADALPGFDSALLHFLRYRLEQLGRARMQRTRLAVQEERHRHAPLTLP